MAKREDLRLIFLDHPDAESGEDDIFQNDADDEVPFHRAAHDAVAYVGRGAHGDDVHQRVHDSRRQDAPGAKHDRHGKQAEGQAADDLHDRDVQRGARQHVR